MQPILLASSSIYRRSLFARLGLNFDYASPDIDESLLPYETPDQLVSRLSETKARVLANTHPSHLIVGSDQVAVLEGQILGKPHNHERAFQQLKAASGKEVSFKTGLCVLNAATDEQQLCVEEYRVQFRELSDEQINHYLSYEQPFDCAGSFKCEGLGIILFEKLSGDDPNTLIGLPLIRLVDMLRFFGIDPLIQAHLNRLNSMPF